MIVNCNRNIVDIQYEFGEEVVLMGAGLFSLQTKLSDEAVWSVIYYFEYKKYACIHLHVFCL